MRRLFAEGAMSQAFVPVLSEAQQTENKARQLQLAGGVLGTLLLVVGILTVVVVCGAPWAIRLYAPGFADQGGRFVLAVQLLRWTFPYLCLISVTAFFAAILNCQGRFAVTASAPILLNLSLILGFRVIYRLIFD